MDLKRFKELYSQFKKHPPRNDLPEFNEYVDAMYGNVTLSNWHDKQRCKEAGIDYKLYCCLDMAVRMIDDKKTKSAEYDSDCVMTYSKYHKEFGIPVHDGGQSFIRITFCPWCGTKLQPISKRASRRP